MKLNEAATRKVEERTSKRSCLFSAFEQLKTGQDLKRRLTLTDGG